MTATALRLVEGDCRVVCRRLADASVDLVVADPPYGETKLAWDRAVEGWLDELPRILKPHGSLWCFGSLRFFMRAADAFRGWTMCQEIVWHKHNGSGPVGKGRFNRVHELAAQFRPAGRPWSAVVANDPVTFDAASRSVPRRGRALHRDDYAEHDYRTRAGGPRRARSVIQERSCHGAALHPTQKPQQILRTLIETSSMPGATVLDPFGGSGAVGAAASTGRSAILIERLHAHVEQAAARLRRDAPSAILDVERAAHPPFAHQHAMSC